MRSLEECQAEIFRRSEEKIQKRKKIRNSCLLIALPVCLCAAVFLFVIQPKNAANPTPDIKIAASEPTAVPTTQPLITQDMPVLLSAVSVNNRLLDGENLEEQWKYINGLPWGSPPLMKEYEEDMMLRDDMKFHGSSTTAADIICFTFSDGTTETYYLQDGVLTREGTEGSLTLSDEELKTLYLMFDIKGGKK